MNVSDRAGMTKDGMPNGYETAAHPIAIGFTRWVGIVIIVVTVRMIFDDEYRAMV